MRIGLLNNLRAGRSHAQVWRLLQLLRSYPEILHVETERAGAVPEALADLSRQEVDLLVVNGGDGTLARALTDILEYGAFEGPPPMIAVLRGGRTNMTALDLRAQRDPIKSMRSLIEAARSGEIEQRVQRRNVMRLEYGPGRSVRCGMFFGGGVIHRAIDLIHNRLPQGRVRGVAGATAVTGALVARQALRRSGGGILSVDKAQVRLDGEGIPQGEFRLFMASTLPQLFSRMRPFWGEGPGGVRFTAVTTDASRIPRAAPGILAGRPNRAIVNEQNGYLSRNVAHLELRFDCGSTIDGEQSAPLAGRTVSITADHSVRFVRA